PVPFTFFQERTALMSIALFITLASNPWIQILVSLLASTLLLFGRHGSRLLILLLSLFILVGLVDGLVIMGHIQTRWVWYLAWSVPLFQGGTLLKALFLFSRLHQKQLSIAEKAALWSQAAAEQARPRPFAEAVEHILYAVESERHVVSVGEVKRALRRAGYPREHWRTQETFQKKPLPKMVARHH
ncbi:MAG: hypothetical protein J2P36_16145, partial [Ktedonobacteraceae bacterium]|nr:hypothetical protein [Ktedonobacteraceae bacterium]